MFKYDPFIIRIDFFNPNLCIVVLCAGFSVGSQIISFGKYQHSQRKKGEKKLLKEILDTYVNKFLHELWKSISGSLC